MSMKKTDLVKGLAKKLDGRMKSAGVPPRFGQGAAAVDAVDEAAKREQRARDAAAKLVPLACRLPADLVKRVRDAAIAHDGGINALMAQALERWLEADKT